MKKFWALFRFEVRHQLRRPATWVYLGVLLAIGILRADATDTGVVHFHAPVNAAFSTVLAGAFGILVTAGLFVEAAHRDARWGMDPLVYTSPLRKRDYLGGRFLGAFVINALLLTVVPIGLVLGAGLTDVSVEALGRARFEAYVGPYLFFLLPGLLVNAAVLFGATLLSRRSLPAYLGALGLTAAYLYASLIASGQSSWIGVLLDPTGVEALSSQTAAWTRAELNGRLVGLEGALLWNRLFWMILAVGLLALVYRRFRFVHAAEGSRRAWWSNAAPSARLHAEPAPGPLRVAASAPGRSVAVPRARRSFGPAPHVRQTLAVAWNGMRQTVFSRDFVLVALGIVTFALLILMQMVVSGTPQWPLTHHVAAYLTGRTMSLLITLLTIFYAGELVWKERDAGIDKIADSAPVLDVALFVGKLLALFLTVAALQAVLMAAGILAQVLQGYYAFEPGLYLQILLGMQLPDYLLFGVLALSVHVAANHKYVGHLVAAVLVAGFLFASQLGIQHNLLIYGSDPGWAYSDLNGFDSFVVPFVWFKLYWASWALLLGLAALIFWLRGADDGLRARIVQARRRLTRPVIATAAAGVVLIGSTGGFVFYNTNVVNEYRTTWEQEEVFAEYERRYKRFQHAPQPRLTGIRLRAELYPTRREAILRGTYRLVNRTDVPVDSIHLSFVPRPEVAIAGVQLDRSSRVVLEDAKHGYHVYALERSLTPGDSLEMHFELEIMRRGFENRAEASRNEPMVGDYTHLGSWLLPVIGYQREAMELSSPAARRAHGLPPTDIRPSLHDSLARRTPRIAPWSDWIDLEVTVGTSLDHTAVLPGVLEQSWTGRGRRYFHYKTDAPILNFFSVISAPFAVRESTWKDVEISVLHHPDHDFNVDRIMRDVRLSLDYYADQFGPYPYRRLSMVEFPGYGIGARAYAGLIIYSERHPIALARTAETYRAGGPLQVTAHEVAHQWWGQQVMGADVQGSQMLSETLAQYSSAMVLERSHGDDAIESFMESMQWRYLGDRGRHRTPEAPLVLTTDHAYLHYGKGAVAMYALKDYVGEERINEALHRLIQRFGKKGPPYPTTLDLYEELQAVTPDSLQHLLEDLLATITLWDLQAISVHVEPAGGDEYRVTLGVQAAKVRADSVGHETEIPMDDLVDIGIYAEDGQALYLRKHRLRSGLQSITVTVRGMPARAIVDPLHLLIDRTLEDNAVSVEERSLENPRLLSPSAEPHRRAAVQLHVTS